MVVCSSNDAMFDTDLDDSICLLVDKEKQLVVTSRDSVHIAKGKPFRQHIPITRVGSSFLCWNRQRTSMVVRLSHTNDF